MNLEINGITLCKVLEESYSFAHPCPFSFTPYFALLALISIHKSFKEDRYLLIIQAINLRLLNDQDQE
jgi:hypothetical protein